MCHYSGVDTGLKTIENYKNQRQYFTANLITTTFITKNEIRWCLLQAGRWAETLCCCGHLDTRIFHVHLVIPVPGVGLGADGAVVVDEVAEVEEGHALEKALAIGHHTGTGPSVVELPVKKEMLKIYTAIRRY